MDDEKICENCIHGKGLFYLNTGTCESYLFLGECSYEKRLITQNMDFNYTK